MEFGGNEMRKEKEDIDICPKGKNEQKPKLMGFD